LPDRGASPDSGRPRSERREQPSGTRPGARRGELGERVRVTLEAVGYGAGHFNALDLTEAYAEFRPCPRGVWRARLKAGAFYPPISLENRPGYHAGLAGSWRGRLELRVLRYDNRADPRVEAPSIPDYAWWTWFNSHGLRWEPDERWTLIAQRLQGRTDAGDDEPTNCFTSSAAFALVSYTRGRACRRPPPSASCSSRCATSADQRAPSPAASRSSHSRRRGSSSSPPTAYGTKL